MSNDEDLEAMRIAMEEVRASFVASIPERRSKLDGAIALWRTGDRQGSVAARAIAHALRGTAGTLGFDALSDAGRELEAAIDRGARAEESAALIANVLRELAAAAAPPPPPAAAESSQTSPSALAPPARKALRAIMDTMPERDRVLAIDDDATQLAAIRATLEPAGIDVATVSDGHNALDVARHFSPDLLLLDVEMPELDGFAVLESLKRAPHLEEVPVIFLTAKADVADRVRAFDAGAEDFIAKPFTPDDLRSRVLHRLGRGKLRRARDTKAAEPRSMRALVADDEPMVRALVSRLLERDGWKVDHAGDGLLATEMIAQAARAKDPYTLIVLDLHMPRRSGFEVLKELPASSPQTRAVVLSAQSRDADVVRALGSGAADFVAKPFSAPKLMARIARLFPAEKRGG